MYPKDATVSANSQVLLHCAVQPGQFVTFIEYVVVVALEVSLVPSRWILGVNHPETVGARAHREPKNKKSMMFHPKRNIFVRSFELEEPEAYFAVHAESLGREVGVTSFVCVYCYDRR